MEINVESMFGEVEVFMSEMEGQLGIVLISGEAEVSMSATEDRLVSSVSDIRGGTGTSCGDGPRML